MARNFITVTAATLVGLEQRSSAQPPQTTGSKPMNWRPVGQNWVLLPRRPVAVIHFLGGAFVGAAPQFSYGKLLEFLAAQGYVIIATPFINTLDHQRSPPQCSTNLRRPWSNSTGLESFKGVCPFMGWATVWGASCIC